MVLKLCRSDILQTEVLVLYKLLYVLNNSARGNKTFKGLKQVRTVNTSSTSGCDGGNVPVIQASPSANTEEPTDLFLILPLVPHRWSNA